MACSAWKRVGVQAARGTILTVAAIGACAVLLSTFQMPGAKASRTADDDDRPTVGAAPTTTPTAADSHVVMLDREGQAKGGIESSVPRPSPFQGQVHAYGTVLALDRLTSLYNASLIDAAQLRAAEVRMVASRTANERAQNLLKVFSTAKAPAEAADASYQIDAAGVDASKAQLEALRNTAIQDWGTVLGPAIVARAPLAEGLVLRKTCLIQLSVPTGSAMAPPQRVSLTLGTGFIVEAVFVAPATQADPKIQGSSFLYVLPISAGITAAGMVPGTNVLASFPAGGVKPGVEIPPSAVVWQAGKAWMYLRTAADKFERRPLDGTAAPTADGGYVVPAKSLPQHQALVIAGAQILLSQESRAQIPSDEDDN